MVYPSAAKAETMSSKSFPLLVPKMPLTFSKRNALGCTLRTTSTYDSNKLPLLSSFPAAPPARRAEAEKVWQGGPPIIISILSGNMEKSIVVMSCSATTNFSGSVLPRFCRRVSQQSWSKSVANNISKPACSKPMSSPPPPENRLNVLMPFSAIYLYKFNLPSKIPITFGKSKLGTCGLVC